MKTTILKRIEKLRNRMKNEGISYCLIPSTDFHASEYIAPYFKVTEFFSGCTSDNVMLAVCAEEAALWTDARYFISAAKELEGTGIELMKSGEPGVPSVTEFLKSRLKEGDVLGYDGRVISAYTANEYRTAAASGGWSIRSDFDAAGDIPEAHPALPDHPVWFLDEKRAGESSAAKLQRIREAMEKYKTDVYIVTGLDEIMWTLNMRGSDIDYNPTALAFMALYKNGGRIYLQKNALSETKDFAEDYFKSLGLTLCDYERFYEDLAEDDFYGENSAEEDGIGKKHSPAEEDDGGKEYSARKEEGIQTTERNSALRVMFDVNGLSDRILENILRKNLRPVPVESPINRMKAVKNPTELCNIRECYLRDSVAVWRFICELQRRVEQASAASDCPAAKTGLTELSAAELLYSYRAQIEDFMGLSFETISAYADNAAIVHYAPKEEHDREILTEGFLLVDSGGQYKSGTTDITRTLVLGEISEEMRRDFTSVAVANLRLLTARFEKGCSGVNLDMFARIPLWERGIDFKHGTGHGIGYILNVHEGPHNIAWKSRKNKENVGIEPGMIFSDEPGIYREGKYGIRTESVVECLPDEENEFASFLRLSPLTFVPIDLKAIDVSMMEEKDIERLNGYHELVFRKISPCLTDEDEIRRLREATKKIGRKDPS